MTDLPLEAKRLAVTRYLVFADCVEEDVLKSALQDIVFDFLHEFTEEDVKESFDLPDSLNTTYALSAARLVIEDTFKHIDELKHLFEEVNKLVLSI